MDVSCDPESATSRFLHLLRPIRDLSENWNIDLATQLEDYIQELSDLTFSFQDGDEWRAFNFAEAALLIQGSTCVYSRKVEFLYDLVKKTWEKLLQKKRIRSGGVEAESTEESDDIKFYDDPPFLPLDDFVEAENVDLSSCKGRTNGDVDQIGSKEFPRSNVIPAAFASWEEKKRSCEESGNPALRMSLCTMHPSGAALMDPTDAVFGLSGDGDGGEFTDVEAMDREDDDMRDDMRDDAASSIGDDISTPPPMSQLHSERWMLLSPSTPIQSKTTGMPAIPYSDPYELLDPHDPGNIRPIPFKRRPTKFQQKDVKRNQGFRNIDMWVKELHDSFAACKKRRVPSSSWSVLNPLFSGIAEEKVQKESSRRRKWWKERSGVDVRMEWLEDVETAQDYDSFGRPHLNGLDRLDAASDFDDDDASGADGGEWFGDEDGDDGHHISAKNRMETLESKSETYEQRCRRLLEHASAEAHAMLAEEEVLARVEAWRVRMEPLLEEQDRIGHFDIGAYEDHILGTFEGGDIGSSIGFTQIVEKEAHSVSDVCRMFVASLQLVADGNVGFGERDATSGHDTGDLSLHLRSRMRKQIPLMQPESAAPTSGKETADVPVKPRKHAKRARKGGSDGEDVQPVRRSKRRRRAK
eukprot:TRINITY_DN38214_c0_g1_i1.p1 TRINITY_DN38214_c0_g1~~TRINITY_DN38214_c0_g1_i1.p1  ORF type:complete len:668 (-),score=209.20 TRINITY_DN38214_c0_g1_i1:109-2025(-)